MQSESSVDVLIAAFAHSQEAVVLIAPGASDSEPRPIYVNPIFTRHYGFTLANAGDCLLFAQTVQNASTALQKAVQQHGNASKAASGETSFPDKKGRKHRVTWSVRPVFLQEAEPFCLVVELRRCAPRQSQSEVVKQHTSRASSNRSDQSAAGDLPIPTAFERLALLRAIDVSIALGMDLEATLRIILDQICSMLKLDAAAILLLAQGGEFSSTIKHGVARNLHLPSEILPQGGAAGLAVREGRITYFTDIPEEAAPLYTDVLPDKEVNDYLAIPLRTKESVWGVLELFHHEAIPSSEEWWEVLEALRTQASISIQHASILSDLKQANHDLTTAYDATIQGWSHALDLRDNETAGHSERVTDMTLRIAAEMGVDEHEMILIRRGALLHDIGKMAIPDAILLKPDKLTEEEWEVMRKHPVYAYELLYPIAFLRTALDIPLCHHEKWDGAGYPYGLKEKQIPLAARIFTVADVWDALRSDRPYRAGWPVEKVRDYIVSLSGSQFDPEVVEVFLKLQNDMRDTAVCSPLNNPSPVPPQPTETGR